MKVKIENQNDEPIRVIVDYDNVNETILDAGASDVFESEDEGVIELREGDGSDDIQRDDE
ncbi:MULTISPECIES: hypothetical protein [unclassified Caballeronia]|jgi:hypothetical protein|uniref:hypothetical protein n=1 Tax=unclassified Caballeronia TaxID=2646786 RepID=UPI0020294CFF|nr:MULTISPECIES: hypothetical protein [unclassified Caballeronia]